ncbi:MAG: DUF4932 domain-containing protein [Phycisphaerae bacterium]|jgi:hypothetical protein
MAKLESRIIVATTLMAAIGISSAWGQTQTKPASRPTIDVTVDPQVELLSIIFRLVGNPEYNQTKVPGYAKDVDDHFAAFKDHAVVQTARQMRAQHGVAYDAPMSLAVHLKDVANFEPILPLQPWPEGLDGRWQSDTFETFLSQAKDFAAASGFQSFFDAHQALYQQSVSRMRQLLAEQAHLDWFDSFFGMRQGCRFHLVLGMLNGPMCYGPHVERQGQWDLYCILGVWTVDNQGIPIFGKAVMPTVVHEFTHSYVNPLVDKWAPQLSKAGGALFQIHRQRMSQMAYKTWQIMIKESLVRASVIRQIQRYEGPAAAKAATTKEVDQGFVWMPGLVDLLGQYERERSKYPTFEAFMPRVVEFFNAAAAPPAAPSASNAPATPR